MNEEEAKLLAEVLEVLYSDYPYAVAASALKQARTGYDVGWQVVLSHDGEKRVEALYSRKAVLEHIRMEVKL
jgi:hypothetical protein